MDSETKVKQNYRCFSKQQFMVDERYSVYDTLGQGAYGIVCYAEDSSSRYQFPLAVKKVSGLLKSTIHLKRAIREIKLLRFFQGHKNVIYIHDVDYVSQSYNPFNGLYCFQEFIDYDLHQLIRSHVSSFTDYHYKHFAYQILCGLKYIHSADVIHRDLKPSNILINKRGNLKICDFGLARGVSFINNDDNKVKDDLTSYVATRYYRAPELFLISKRYGKYTKAVDIWSVGCILCELVTKTVAFCGNSSSEQLLKIIKGMGNPNGISLYELKTLGCYTELFSANKTNKIPTLIPQLKLRYNLDPQFVKLIESTLQYGPVSRATVAQCLNHPYLRNVRDISDEPESLKKFDFSYEESARSTDDYFKEMMKEVEHFKEIRKFY